MVDYDVYHEEHPPSVYLITKILQICGCTESVIEFSDVRHPISVISVSILCTRAIIILVHGRNPDRSKSHRLDIVKMFGDSIPCSATKGLI
jgi:hypothetical protein